MWDDPPIDTLGIYVTNNIDDMIELNLVPLLEKAKTVLQSWASCPLTLMGRVLVVNTLVESLFVYRLTILPFVESEYFDNLHTLVTQFIWKNKRPKISQQVLVSPKKQGGLRLVNFNYKHVSLLCKWVFKIQRDEMLQRHAWGQLNSVLKDHIWLINLKRSTVKMLFGKSFWSGVLTAWCMYNYVFPMTYNEVKNQFLWLNEFIRINKQPVIYERMY